MHHGEWGDDARVDGFRQQWQRHVLGNTDAPSVQVRDDDIQLKDRKAPITWSGRSEAYEEMACEMVDKSPAFVSFCFRSVLLCKTDTYEFSEVALQRWVNPRNEWSRCVQHFKQTRRQQRNIHIAANKTHIEELIDRNRKTTRRIFLPWAHIASNIKSVKADGRSQKKGTYQRWDRPASGDCTGILWAGGVSNSDNEDNDCGSVARTSRSAFSRTIENCTRIYCSHLYLRG